MKATYVRKAGASRAVETIVLSEDNGKVTETRSDDGAPAWYTREHSLGPVGASAFMRDRGEVLRAQGYTRT